MRVLKLSDGTLVPVRGLRRSEIKALSHYGVGYMRCELFALPKDQQDQAIDAVLATQLIDAELDNLTNAEMMAIFNGIIRETYSAEDEEKNLSGSGPNDQTPSDGSTAEHA